MMHLYRVSETTGKYSGEEHFVVADSIDEAVKIANREKRPYSKRMTTDDCSDWGEITTGWKGSVSTGDN